MIKNLLNSLLIFSLILTTCGCNALSVFSSDSHKFLISALGFAESEGKITLYAEALVINSEDMNADKKRVIFEGSGYSCESALTLSKSNATENFDLSHCGILALSTGLSNKNLTDILNWCYNTDSITLTAKIVSCENPKKLLESTPVSSVTAGYDILSLLEKTNETSGIEYKNSLFEVINKKESKVNVFSLPNIVLENDKRAISGLSVFKNNSYLLNLDEEQTFLYSLITDSFSSGNIILNNETYFIKSSKTTYKTEKSGKFNIKFLLKSTKDIKREIKKNIEDFIDSAGEIYGDIFEIGNIIEYQNPRFFENIKNDFNKLNFTVAVK